MVPRLSHDYYITTRYRWNTDKKKKYNGIQISVYTGKKNNLKITVTIIVIHTRRYYCYYRLENCELVGKTRNGPRQYYRFDNNTRVLVPILFFVCCTANLFVPVVYTRLQSGNDRPGKKPAAHARFNETKKRTVREKNPSVTTTLKIWFRDNVVVRAPRRDRFTAVHARCGAAAHTLYTYQYIVTRGIRRRRA